MACAQLSDAFLIITRDWPRGLNACDWQVIQPLTRCHQRCHACICWLLSSGPVHCGISVALGPQPPTWVRYLHLPQTAAEALEERHVQQYPNAGSKPAQFQVPHNEPKKCESTTPFLVLLISTNHKEFDARQAIRETWGDENTFGDVRILTLFLLGYNTEPVLNQMVEQESQIFHDILVEDFVDSYHNLTLKTLMGMRWVFSFCPNAQYVMKTDSDIFVNMDNLVFNLLRPNSKPRRRFFTGHVYKRRTLRDVHSKWFMPRELYPEAGTRPFALVLDKSSLETSQSWFIRPPFIQDFYIWRMCMWDCACGNWAFGLSRTVDSITGKWPTVSAATEKSWLYIRSHPEEILRIWNDMSNKKHLKC